MKWFCYVPTVVKRFVFAHSVAREALLLTEQRSNAVITICDPTTIRLRSDYDVSRAPISNSTQAKNERQFFVVVESQLWYRLNASVTLSYTADSLPRVHNRGMTAASPRSWPRHCRVQLLTATQALSDSSRWCPRKSAGEIFFPGANCRSGFQH